MYDLDSLDASLEAALASITKMCMGVKSEVLLQRRAGLSYGERKQRSLQTAATENHAASPLRWVRVEMRVRANGRSWLPWSSGLGRQSYSTGTGVFWFR